MPESDYTVLNARVKQKIDTEANWISEEGTFGVLFEGEQAFVRESDGTPVNFKIGDGTKTFSQLPYFIAYYSGKTNQTVLSYETQTTNITIPSIFRNKSFLTDIIFLNTFGSTITLNIGTTDGGSEIAQIDLTTGVNIIGLKKYFESATTLYFTGLTSKTFSMYVLYIQLDEAPAMPPTGGTVAPFFPKGFMGSFRSSDTVYIDSCWDFSSGLGKPNTGYSNCAICNGENGTSDMSDYYQVGMSIGETIGAVKGTNANVVLTRQNLPKLLAPLPSNISGVHGSGGILYGGLNNNTVNVVITGEDGTPTSNPATGFSVRPKSRIVLMFEAIS